MSYNADFTGRLPKDTYQSIINTDMAGGFYNSTGSRVDLAYLTSSWATSASWAPGGATGTTLFTGSTYPITSSWAINAANSISSSWSSQSLSSLYASSSNSSSYANTASLLLGKASGSIPTWVSFYGTSSWAINSLQTPTSSISITASYSETASYAVTSSYYSYTYVNVTQSFISMSSADSASWASMSLSSLYSTNSVWSISASWASSSLNSRWAISASWASMSLSSLSASWASMSLSSLYSTSSRWSTSASWASASHTSSTLLGWASGSIPNWTSFYGTSSWALNCISSSFSETASYVRNLGGVNDVTYDSTFTNSTTPTVILSIPIGNNEVIYFDIGVVGATSDINYLWSGNIRNTWVRSGGGAATAGGSNVTEGTATGTDLQANYNAGAIEVSVTSTGTVSMRYKIKGYYITNVGP